MLDTNTVSNVLRRPSERLDQRLIAAREQGVCISAITEGELRFGLQRAPAATRIARLVEAFLATVEVRPFGSDAATCYGDLRARLEKTGDSLGALDTLIGAHALAEGATLVTSDEAFRRVPDLKVENWLAD